MVLPRSHRPAAALQHPGGCGSQKLFRSRDDPGSGGSGIGRTANPIRFSDLAAWVGANSRTLFPAPWAERFFRSASAGAPTARVRQRLSLPEGWRHSGCCPGPFPLPSALALTPCCRWKPPQALKDPAIPCAHPVRPPGSSLSLKKLHFQLFFPRAGWLKRLFSFLCYIQHAEKKNIIIY